MGIYPFGFFYTSTESSLCTEFELKSDLTVESAPSSVDNEYNITIELLIAIFQILDLAQIVLFIFVAL
jgi:hypothetical protein